MVSFAMACTGEPKVLEPRSPPPRYVPRVHMPASRPPAGAGRVVLDTTDGPMRVSVRADQTFVPPGADVPPTRSGELCVTPCAADLPAGRYKLFLVSADGSVPGGDVDTLDVRPGGVNYHVRAPGRSEPREWLPAVPFVMTVAGAIALTSGAYLLTTGEDGAETTGAVFLVGGVVAMTAAGFVYYDASRGTQQEGATTHWWEPVR